MRNTLRASRAPGAWALVLAPFLIGPAHATASACLSSSPAGATQTQDEQNELALARADADRLRRLGDPRADLALRRLLGDDEADHEARAIYAQLLADGARWEDALRHLARLAEAGASVPRAVRARAARTQLEVLLTLGRVSDAQGAVERARDALQPVADARDAWWFGELALARGERESARRHWTDGVADAATGSWERALAKARCQRALGDLPGASRTLVDADRAAQGAEGLEPDLLAELASLYFEADGELEDQRAAPRAPGALYRKALELNRTHAASLLGMFELGRFNWNRQSTPAQEYLVRLLDAQPQSVRALLAGAASDLDDGKLVSARERMAQVRALAPDLRQLATLDAALAWVEHRREECRALLAKLADAAPYDSAPEREVGGHLNELYRFAEAVEFLRAATQRDESDYEAWMELGRALANSGDEKGALEALTRSQAEARGRQNAWRHNTKLVLERIQSKFVVEKGAGELSYAWHPQAADVLRTYWLPFYESARAELSQRYAFTPGPVAIEVFERFGDFSVRSTGFEGFPALGVCFGPVVTAVAPHSEMRGRFSWARTAFHEFTHVIHLGLSHNRCPRWITEGLATWEEENKNPAWSRNMRRELLDAYSNGDLIAVRDLNRAFRSQRILFGYYQSGLLCRMWIEERGFAPLIALLEAFDRGADVDGAMREVFGSTPEALDKQFHDWVQARLANLSLEPRWTNSVIVRKKLSLKDQAPSAVAERTAWAEGWTTVAWGYHQQERKVDAEQALRRLDAAQLDTPRAQFLRGEMALGAGDSAKAREHYERGLSMGGEDYRVRMALGKMAQRERDYEKALEQFLAAERAFPGYDEAGFSAELHLASVYDALGREEDQYGALERRLQWTSDDYPTTVRVAQWHAEHGRHERAAQLFESANQIDPFRRALHVQWGKSLREIGRHSEALREFRVAAQVPVELDVESPDPMGDNERAALLGAQALESVRLDEDDEGRALAAEALALDSAQEDAERALEELRKKGS